MTSFILLCKLLTLPSLHLLIMLVLVNGVNSVYIKYPKMIYQRDVEVTQCCEKNNVPVHCINLCNGKAEKFYGEEICIGAYDNTRIYCVQLELEAADRRERQKQKQEEEDKLKRNTAPSLEKTHIGRDGGSFDDSGQEGNGNNFNPWYSYLEKSGTQNKNGIYGDDTLPGLNLEPFGNNQVSLKFEFGSQPQGEAVSARKDDAARILPRSSYTTVILIFLIFRQVFTV